VENGFNGFPPGAVTFLEGLREHNEKPWFEAHRQQYEDDLLEPGRVFAEAMAARLDGLMPPESHPVRGSLFRIYRDVRFSKDKTPYKTHLGIAFGPEGRSKESAGFYFQIDPVHLFLGAGMHAFPKEVLAAFRDAAVDPVEGPRLREAIEAVTASGPYEVWGQSYKKVPRGYDPAHENADLLLYGGLFAGLTTPLPPELSSAGLLDFCEAHYRAVLPVQSWVEGLLLKVGAA
jgi:uncharacterized protein (TIGR02453 family)